MNRVYIKESLQDNEGDGTELPILVALRKMRDEVTGIAMMKHRGQNRALAMVITKLDEAEQWATRWAIETGRVMIVNREDLLRDTTHATHETRHEGGSHV